MHTGNLVRPTGVVVLLLLASAASAACRPLTSRNGLTSTPGFPTTSSVPSMGNLAFVGFDNGVSQLRVITGAGLEVRDVTSTMSAIMHLSWSSDGRSIAYEACEGSGSQCDSDMEIYVLDVDGGIPRNLSSNPAEDRFPTWSPDGQNIAFISDRTGNQDIFLVARDGSALTQLTETPEQESSPEWSPDGRGIAFERSTYSANGMFTSIWLATPDGTGFVPIATLGTDPHWSPDSSLIAFHCSSDAYLRICTVRTDGTQTTELTSSGADAFGYDWSPDGRLIAFASNLGSEINIHVVCPNCEQPFNLRQLTAGPPNDHDPVWSPDGTMIAYSEDEKLAIMTSTGEILERFPFDVLGPASWQP